MYFRTKKGFTLLELLIAVFIFSLIMVTSTSFFSRSIKTYKSVRSTQRNLEDAQFALSSMAKTIRTSTIIDPVSAQTAASLIVYDYSRTVDACIQYSFSSNRIQSRSADVPRDNCTTSTTFGSYSNLSNVYVNNAYFFVNPSNGTSHLLGRVTISLDVCATSLCSEKAKIQSSVSLRDYGIAAGQ